MCTEIYNKNEKFYMDILKKSSSYKDLLDFNEINNLIIQNSINRIIKKLNNIINQTSYDNASRIIPIIISSGIDHSPLYYILKNIVHNWKIIHIPNPPVDVRIFFHIYTCIIEELGLEILLDISLNSVKKKIAHTCVKIVRIYSLSDNRREVAMRWLLGEYLNAQELSYLNIKFDIKDDDISLEMIKLISENTDNILVLYFDEIEGAYKNYGEEAEEAKRKILESIKRLHHYIKKLSIIIINSKELWAKILDLAGPSLSSTLEQELEIKPFNLIDFKKFVANSMEIYWKKNNVIPPSNPFYPLNEKLIEIFFHETKGNPRLFVKFCNKFIEKIIKEELSLEQLI